MSHCARLLWAYNTARPVVTGAAAAAEAQYRRVRPRPASSSTRRYSSQPSEQLSSLKLSNDEVADTSRSIVKSSSDQRLPDGAYAYDGVPLHKLSLSSLLNHFTRFASQRARLSVGPTLDALCVGTDHNKAASLRIALRTRGISEDTFLGWRNAVCERDWSNAMRQLSHAQYEAGIWPGFLLLRLLPLVSSAPQALHALHVLQRSAPAMHLLPATRAWTMLLERCLLDLKCVHLAPQLTQSVLEHTKRLLSSSSPATFLVPTHELLLRLTAGLIRHADARARRAAERLLRAIAKVQDQSASLAELKTRQAMARLLLNMDVPLKVRSWSKKELANRRTPLERRVDEAELAAQATALEAKGRKHTVALGSPDRITDPLVRDVYAPVRSSRFLTLQLATLALEHAGLEEEVDDGLTRKGMRTIAGVAQREGEGDIAREWLMEMSKLRSKKSVEEAVDEADGEVQAELQRPQQQEGQEQAAEETVFFNKNVVVQQRRDLALLASLDEADQAWSLFNSMLSVAETTQQRSLSALQAKHNGNASKAELYSVRHPIRQGLAPNAWDWRAVVSMAARDVSVHPTALLRYLKLYEETGGVADPIRARLPNAPAKLRNEPSLYNDLMRNFARRPRVPISAIRAVWKAMRRRNVEPDAETLATYCKALMQDDEIVEALRVLMQYAAFQGTPDAPPPSSLEQEEAEPQEQRRSVKPTTMLFNILLDALQRRGQHLAVWKLYTQTLAPTRSRSDTTMGQDPNANERNVNVGRDVRTLSTLLRSAAHAGHAFLRAEQERDLLLWRSTAASAEVLWDDVPAPQCARAVFREALFRQHPELRNLRSALVQASEGAGWAWKGEMRLRQFEQWLEGRLKGFVGGGGGKTQQAERQRWRSYMDDYRADTGVSTRRKMGSWNTSTIVFDARVFHDYLQLLRFRDVPARRADAPFPLDWRHAAKEEDEQTDEVFHVLAWMRALHLEPTRQSLCVVCLTLNAITPPIFYAGATTEEECPAGPLQGWLEEWLGEEAVPTMEEVWNYGKEEQKRWYGDTDVVTQSG